MAGGGAARADPAAPEALGEAAYARTWDTGLHLQLADVLELAGGLILMPTPPAPSPDLTPRELEVLALGDQSHPDRRVARLLNISPAMASKHVGNLLGKPGLHNRVELARWAIAHGLADSATPVPPLP